MFHKISEFFHGPKVKVYVFNLGSLDITAALKMSPEDFSRALAEAQAGNSEPTKILAKFEIYIGDIASHNDPGQIIGEPTRKTYHSHAIVIRNDGSVPALNVILTHLLPEKLGVIIRHFPADVYRQKASDAFIIPILAPGEQVCINCLIEERNGQEIYPFDIIKVRYNSGVVKVGNTLKALQPSWSSRIFMGIVPWLIAGGLMIYRLLEAKNLLLGK